ncbi:MAG: 16S rRNA (cytosine(1402)-N(4))-methyltransferase RsmH [Candidatus Doudnabacteria bacterium]|nr:16S rRNA (cytosine(1402)-N(4))-methyltransferase RsmH [Candidatus Doudnabacteria bacterium]
MSHTPVLLKEVIELLDPTLGEKYIDATLGGGGYAQAILKKIGPSGKLLAIDADPEALKQARNQSEFAAEHKRVTLLWGNFRDLKILAHSNGLNEVNGIVFDLGLSSAQLDVSQRGFSFQRAGPLDMRFDQTQGSTAAELLRSVREDELAKLLRVYGEERRHSRIAGAIVAHRKVKPLVSTADLYEVIAEALGSQSPLRIRDAARRVFQALRIAINDELTSLTLALPQAFQLLASGGKLAVVSFHSLEDRIVKKFFLEISHGCTCPPEFPMCVCGKKSMGSVLTKKPIRPQLDEVAKNPRAKSGKLRVLKKF